MKQFQHDTDQNVYSEGNILCSFDTSRSVLKHITGYVIYGIVVLFIFFLETYRWL